MCKLSIVIPSRNRPELLKIALSSLLDHSALDFEVVVSDNSTGDIAKANAEFVFKILDDRVRYVKPPYEMSMVDHWNWALEQASGDYVGFLTDRMAFKKGAVSNLLDALEKNSPDLLVYFHDRLLGNESPYSYRRKKYTNDVLAVNSSVVIKACQRGHISRLWPRMLNSVCARHVLDEMKLRYGRVFSGVCPDYSFCFQALDLLDTFHLFDARLLISAGHGASNGFSFYRGSNDLVKTDFVSLSSSALSPAESVFFENRLIHWAIPVPYVGEILEYLRVREFYNSSKLGDIDYLSFYMKASARIEYLRRMGFQSEAAENGLALLARKLDIRDRAPSSKDIRHYNFKEKFSRVAKFIWSKVGGKNRENCLFASLQDARAYDYRHPLRKLPHGRTAHFWREFSGTDN